jgi:hypothetical protein
MVTVQVILERLLAKATKVFHDHLSGSSDPRGPPTDASDDAELAIFGGHTLVHQVETKSLSSSSPKHVHTLNSESPSELPVGAPLVSVSSSSASQAGLPMGHIHGASPQSNGGDNNDESTRPAQSDMPMPIDDGPNAFHEAVTHQVFAELSHHQHHQTQSPMTLPSYNSQHDLMLLNSMPNWTNIATGPHNPAWLAPEVDGHTLFPELQGYNNNQGYISEREMVDERWMAFMRDAGILDGFLTSIASDPGTLF